MLITYLNELTIKIFDQFFFTGKFITGFKWSYIFNGASPVGVQIISKYQKNLQHKLEYFTVRKSKMPLRRWRWRCIATGTLQSM